MPSDPGRKGYLERWREISADPKQSRSMRGYLENEFKRVKEGKSFRAPPGYQLQHIRGLEARKCFSYLFSLPNLKSNHRLQHKYDNNGKLLKNYVPAPIKECMKRNPGDMNDMNYQRELRNHWKNCVKNQERQTGRMLTNYRQERENTATKFRQSHNIKYNQYASTVKAGGIELMYPISFKSDFKVASVSVDYNNRQIVVKTQAWFFWNQRMFKFPVTLLEPDELMALEAAVKKTTRKGLMVSLTMDSGKYTRAVDGIIPDAKGSDKILQTLEEADFILGSLVFGVDFRKGNGTKTMSTVESYQNPLDVRLELLAEGLSNADSCSNVPYVFTKFANILPHPTFQVDTEGAQFETCSNGMLRIGKGPLLKIDLRGVYVDWMDSVYYDDKGENCLAENAFVKDFEMHYSDYMEKYPVFARLEQYAAVTSLLLLSPERSQNCVETYSTQTFNNGPSLTESKPTNETEFNHVWTAAQQEEIIGWDSDPMVTLNQLLYISNKWFNLDCFQQSFVAASLILFYGTEILSKDERCSEKISVKVFIAKALLQVVNIMDKFPLEQDDRQFIEQFLFEDAENVPVLNEASSTTSDADDTYRDQAIVMMALELAKQISIEAEDWLTLYLAECFLYKKKVGNICESTNLDENWIEQLKILINNNENLFESNEAGRAIAASFKSILIEQVRMDADVSHSIMPDFTKLLNNVESNEDFSPDTLQQIAGFVFFTESLLTGNKQTALFDAQESRRCFKNCQYLELMADKRIIKVLAELINEIENEEIIDSFCKSATEIGNLLKSGMSPSESLSNGFLKSAHLARQKCLLTNSAEIVKFDEIIVAFYTRINDTEKVKHWKRVLTIDTLSQQNANNDEGSRRQ